MKIDSRFNVGDDVVFIHNDNLVKLPVKEVEYVGSIIRYIFTTYKYTGPFGCGDEENSTIYEEDCFGSAVELAEHYENKWKNDKK